MSRIIPAAVMLAALIVSALVVVPGATAHERRTVAGAYTFVVGFLNEPAYLEEPNAISLTVTNAQTNQPVEGVEKTLKVDATVGGETRTFDLRARFGQPGAYIADLIPTKTGTWAFRFHGTIDGTPLDERFESGPGRFNDVEAKTVIQFPASVPSVGELAGRVQPATQDATASPAVQQALDHADDARQLALLVGGAGVVLGLAGLGVALWALNRSQRPPGAAASRSTEPV